MLQPYDPRLQTPKLVITKKIQAPNKDPIILVLKFFMKLLLIRPIKATLPQVKKVTLCNPITKSVNIKLTNTIGRYLIPKNAGTQKLKAIRLVKFGGCGINLLADRNINTKNETFKYLIFLNYQ